MIQIISADKELINQINSILSEFGFCAKVLSVTEGTENTIEEDKLTGNIIIIDGDNLQTPGNLVAKISEKFPDAYLIYITSNSYIEAVKKIYLAGIHYYSTKPVSDFEFKELFNKLINRKITN